MTHIAITGIGGFIGLAMAERAISKGWSVSGLDHSESAAAKARALGAEVQVADINDRFALEQTFAGAEVVIHTAAVVAENGPRELYERVNNQGTKSVCQVAKAQHVKQLLHLSSIMVYGFNYPDQVAEDGPYASDGNIYNETKLNSEKIALSFNQPGLFDVCVIRPGDVYGAGSVPWVLRPLEMLRQGQLMLPTVQGNTGLINHVYIDNLIDGMLLALEKSSPGEAFNITDDAATPSEQFFAYHATWLGKKKPAKLPVKLLYQLLKLATVLLPRVGLKLPYEADGVRFLSRQHKISCDKAKQRLGYRPKVSLTQGMQQVKQQLQQQKILEADHV